MEEITWQNVMQRSDLVGGFLETITPHGRWAGPIKRIIVTSSEICLRYEWVACFDPKMNRWVKVYGGSRGLYSNTTMLTNLRLEDGKIVFDFKHRKEDYAVIHPIGGWTLALNEVLDLGK